MTSLTLTNPDMILPDNGREHESRTPSPPSLTYLSQLNARHGFQNGSNAAPSMVAPRAKKNFSRPNWSGHEDVNTSGRRLSDIGEELSPARVGGFADGSGGDEGNPRSSSSGSEYSKQSTPQNGQTDVAKGETTEQAGQTGLPGSNAMASAAVEGKGPGDEVSSAILSSEAERILENAKKRLTLMEGNLNRARSTVKVSPSPSPTPSPSAQGRSSPGLQPGGLYRSISRTDRKGSGLRRQSMLSSQDPSSNRHSRVHSETNFPSESSLAADPKRISRSVSAMGASSVSNFHKDERSFPYEPTRAYLTHRASVSSMHPSSSDKELSQATQSPIPDEESSSDSPHGLGISTEVDRSKSPARFSPIYSSYGPPSRPQSQLQVRDLQYQMKGLHIKISSLKVRTQEDNLRRRSLQSLRTPSPLTATEPWYPSAMELRDGRSSRGSTRRGTSAEYSQDGMSDNDATRSKARHSAEDVDRRAVERAMMDLAKQTDVEWQPPGPDEYDDGRSVDDSMYEDEYDGDIDREALDEILREPLDEDLESPSLDAFPAVPHSTDDTPHEEREDAFDYEHFILHSALGNYTRKLRHASNGSAEPKRPKRTERDSRVDSSMSDATDGTFATAIEGEEGPDDEDDILYWDRRFNHELRHRRRVHDHDANHTHETDRSETPRGSRDEDGSGHTTPVDAHHPSTQTAEGTGRPSSAATGTATPTSLVSSLVETVRAAGSVTPTTGGINEDDTQMLERLFQSLGSVCTDLQAITTSPDPDMKAAQVLRRRLDAARRVLDGELDAY